VLRPVLWQWPVLRPARTSVCSSPGLSAHARMSTGTARVRHPRAGGGPGEEAQGMQGPPAAAWREPLCKRGAWVVCRRTHHELKQGLKQRLVYTGDVAYRGGSAAVEFLSAAVRGLRLRERRDERQRLAFRR
jgi:hypothetical protein